MRWSRAVVFSLGALIAPLLSSQVHAASTLVVSTFDEERVEAPGSLATRRIRVSNTGDSAIQARVEPRGVDLLNDGVTRIRLDEDPLWSGRVTVSDSEISLAPGTSREISLTIQIPERAAPDDYLLGMVVSPLPSGAGVRMVNEVGMLIPLSVEGDRHRSLALLGHYAPSFVIGDALEGSVRVTNNGSSLVAGWSEVQVTDALLNRDVTRIQATDRLRIAPGASREFPYRWDAGITAGKFQLPVRVTYNVDNATIAEIAVLEDVWLIHPYLLTAALALLAVIMGYGLRRVKCSFSAKSLRASSAMSAS